MTYKREIPRSLVVADRHVDLPLGDGLCQTADGRVMGANAAHALGKQRARRDKRTDKARGNRHLRRTAQILADADDS